MSNQSTSYSYSSTSYSTSSSSYSNGADGQTSGERHVQTSYTDPSGTTVRSASQNLGGPIVAEERRFDAQGREMLVDGGAGADTSRRIEDVSDQDDEAQKARDREYEERIEEEYAKREGGA